MGLVTCALDDDTCVYSVMAISGSSKPDHIRGHFGLFDFELTPEEIDQITALDRGEKHDWY